MTILCLFGHKQCFIFPQCPVIRAREIVGFAGSGPVFETENRFISRQELYFSRFCNIQTDIDTCQNCSQLIIRCYLA